MKNLLVVAAMVLGFASVSQAGILLEPYVGYESSKSDGATESATGTDMGLRLAYTLPVFFWGGLDVTTGTLKQSGSDDLTRTTMGAVVGVNLPILFRLWASYGFSNELKTDAGKLKGTNTKIGVGFTGLPFVSLNLEMLTDTITEIEAGGISATVDSKSTGYLVSVSLPFNF